MTAHNAEPQLHASRNQRLVSSVWLVLALLSLSLIAIQPFTTGQMPYTDDGTLHLFRTIVLDHSLRYDNPLYPRFSSGLAFGYGAPLFNYFSPLAYYLPRTLHLAGLSFIHAWLAGMIAYLWLAMGGAYLLGKVWTNRYGGIICATAYLYSPYLLYDAVSRGTITEVAALAILPYVMAALKLLADKPGRFSFFASVLSYAVFVPMHNIVTVHGSLLIAPYALLLVWQSRNRLKTFGMLLSAGLLGLGISCFFWLPALAESPFVKINSITEALPSLDVTTHLRSLSEVLMLPPPVDPLQQQAPIPITVNLFVLMMVVIGTPVIWWRTPAMRGIALFCLAATVLALFMNLEVSAWLWRTVPLLNYTQFAWRSLGVGSLSLALASALAVSALFSVPLRSAQKALYAFLLTVLVLYGISFTYRPYFVPEAASVQDAQLHEIRTNEVALSSYSEYLPIWVETLPDPTHIRQAWEHSDVIARLEAPGAEIMAETWSGTSGAVLYRSESEIVAQINWLYFPGWHLAIDNQSVDPELLPDGTMQILLPAGRHLLTIAYKGTLLQSSAVAVSAIALTTTVIAGIMFRSLGTRQPSQMSHLHHRQGLVVVVGLLGLGLYVLKLAVIDHTDNLFRSTHLQSLRNTDPHAFMGDELILLEAEVLDEPVVAGDTLRLRTAWTLKGSTTNTEYAVRYRLTDTMGHELTSIDTYEIGGISTKRWLPGYIIEDLVALPIDRRVVEGTYFVELTVYTTSGIIISEMDTNGFAKRPFTVTRPFKITRPAQFTEVKNNSWTITEGRLSDSEVSPGDHLEIRLAITAGKPVDTLKASIKWISESASRTIETDVFSSKSWDEWIEGEQGIVFVSPFVPSDLTSGSYTLTVSLNSPGSEQSEYVLSTQFVRSFERVFTATEDIESVARWDNGVALQGYRIKRDNLFLCWVADTTILESYHLSVRLFDESGKLIQQRDEIPGNWSRPTTSWSVGEIIESSINLDILENSYVLTLSWYRPTGYPQPMYAISRLTSGEEQFILNVSDLKSLLVANGNSFNCSDA